MTGATLGTALAAATGWDRLVLVASLSSATLASHVPAPVALWAMSVVMFRGGVGDVWGAWIAVVIAVIFGCSLGIKEDLFDMFGTRGSGKRSGGEREKVKSFSVRYEQQLYLHMGVGELYDDDDDEGEEEDTEGKNDKESTL